jgi:hypothetical protein
VNVTKSLSPSSRARGEGRGEGCELRKREQDSRFVAHNRLLFGLELMVVVFDKAFDLVGKG